MSPRRSIPTLPTHYRAPAAVWVLATTWGLGGGQVATARILLALAITVTLIAAMREREDRAAEVVRLAFWAGTVAAAQGPAQTLPAQRREGVASDLR